MCNRRAANFTEADLEYYYSAKYSEEVDGMSESDGQWQPTFHINAFDYSAAPIITSRNPEKIQLHRWGLIPYQLKTLEQAMAIRPSTLMARTEEMYGKFSYEMLAKNGKRCLIPTSGYFEHHHLSDSKGKSIKIPFYIFLKEKPIFSIGGLYCKWTDPVSGTDYLTYTVCTTSSNELTGYIHNSGFRMPVILPDKQSEEAWLDTKLSRDDVMKLCQPISAKMMDAYTVSKVVTSKLNNVPKVMEPFEYKELSIPLRPMI